MLITRLYLRNFRVFEDELELDMPPGLVGIYGPNGAGKSTLLEAILFTLWGRARTAKDEIRSAGVGADCLTEVEFEHEGHLYVVRRTLSGINATVRAQAHCDGLAIAEGVRDTARYVHSVLGMDDAAFRASVFAEQKQLAAFSTQSPAERRRLVLQLLGITPLDGARDAARRDARQSAEAHDRLRRMLPDLDVLRVAAEDAAARAGAAGAVATSAARVAAPAEARATDAAEAFARLDAVREEFDTLAIEGRSARHDMEQAKQAAGELGGELDGLTEAARELARIEPALEGCGQAEHQLDLLRSLARASAAHAAVEVPSEPPPPDQQAHAAAQAAAAVARDELVTVQGLAQAAAAELGRAQSQAKRSASLTAGADCPLCGQALGAAFSQVQDHRAAEVVACEDRVAELDRRRGAAEAAALTAVRALEEESTRTQEAQRVRVAWQQAQARADETGQALAEARATVAAAAPQLLPAATLDAVSAILAEQERRVRAQRQQAAAAERLRGRLERRPAVEAALVEARERAAGAESRLQALQEKAKGLAFDRGALDGARQHRARSAEQAAAVRRTAQDAALAAAQETARAEAAAQRLAEGHAQHDQLGELQSEARHLARAADLLAEFRNTVVASVGPRLAAQAAELFAELTDREYDELRVDPETYELQISDAGRVYGLDRFSGSEIDLANLALRVAISEHVRFQSGGSVGLLVLDEVFGPLDEDRKARMLLALERLRGRFRQVLVVTHDGTIKDQLPHAIEVIKQPGRRATARLVGP